MTSAAMVRAKAAVQRDPDAPTGQPGTCWLDCTCGTRILRLAEDWQSGFRCDWCGAIYDAGGWIIQHSRDTDEVR